MLTKSGVDKKLIMFVEIFIKYLFQRKKKIVQENREYFGIFRNIPSDMKSSKLIY